MSTALWAAILGAAVLWPARLAGPLDGVPLDTSFEAVLIGFALPALIWFHPAVLRSRVLRTLTVALLLWKAVTAGVAVPDGWCLRFTSPVPLFVEKEQVPHSWDVRADWRSAVPQCSAVMTHGYSELERFPAWFYNLPPDNFREAAKPADRPPFTTLHLDLDGYLNNGAPGVFSIAADEDVKLTIAIDGADVTAAALAGLQVQPGLHRVSIDGELVKTHWSLLPMWNGGELFRGTTATMFAPAAVDSWLRPWGRLVAALLILAIALVAAAAMVTRAGRSITLPASAAASTVTALAVISGRNAIIRLTPLLLIAAAAIPLPRRLRNLFGLSLLIGVPFLVLIAALGMPQAGLFTWYTTGDDWWMFQRFAYRIYMEGRWLEGGEPTFWFQPFYRWIVGALHMVFGDSSIGELFWDAACALIGATFAFHIARVVAGFRWGVAAAALTLTLMLLGPAWYLFGRGLSEITSAGLAYAAALFALRGRNGYWPAIVASGLLAVLSFYTRLNNLPIALAVAAFAWPVRQPVASVWRPAAAFARVSKPALAGILAWLAIGLWLFTARTYYYTNVPNMLWGTQAGLLSVWQVPDGGGSIAGNVIGSFLMVVTMNDPPRFDVRAIPLIAGAVAAVLGLLRIGPFQRLPMNAVGLCLAGLAGAFVARGSAYPGRFSVHLIPVTVALTVSAAALLLKRDRVTRSQPPAPQSPDTR